MTKVVSVFEPLVSVVNFSLLVLVCNVLVESQVNGESTAVGICAMPGCNCTIVVHHWINVKCIFADDQVVELHEGTIPADASEVSVSRCRELKIHSGAFTGGAQLKRVHVTGIRSVVAKEQAFHNISSPNPLLEVSECNKVVLESYAFKNARGTLSVSISRCQHVEIKSNAFSWLLRLSVREVPTLDLSSNAFQFDAPPPGRHGPATKIMFQSVKINELPSSVFPSAAAEIRMDDVLIKIIRKDAFSAVTILGIIISNASIFEIESGAFSEETLIPNFEFVDVRVKRIETGAFRAGIENFTIQYSRLEEIESESIDISSASVTFNNNEFWSLRSKAITLKAWSKIVIDQNLLKDLEKNAIVADDIAKATPEFPNIEFSFRGNRIIKAAEGSLGFVAVSQRVSVAKVGNNYFESFCQCHMKDQMIQVTGKNSTAVWMMDSSYCLAGDFLKKCYNMPQGYVLVEKFDNTVCAPNGHITCKEPSEQSVPTISPPSVGPHVYPKQNSYFDVEMSDPEQLQREKRLIVIVCVAAVLLIIAIILASGVVYMRRRGVCPKLSSTPLMNFANSWLSPDNGMTAATSARSISRMSINEYAGLRPETRILDVESQIDDQQQDLEVEGFAYTENKATQTLPEELTEEYLKDLRERLNDPDNYSQARDMIEHLYDLIKVEESCNNNNNSNNNNNNHDDDRTHNSTEEENTYDVIAPRVRRPRSHKIGVDVGTRVPSLEKLLPSNREVRPPIVEYTEPRDHKTNDHQNHLYAELPGDETVPSTSRLSQPILANLAGRAPLPLPPDVVNDHLIVADDDIIYQEAMKSKEDIGKSQQQQRPLNFLRALGESIMGTKTMKRPVNSLLCEYADPSDVTSHLYSELPEPQGNTTPASKMANRPLPTKPDQENIMNLART